MSRIAQRMEPRRLRRNGKFAAPTGGVRFEAAKLPLLEPLEARRLLSAGTSGQLDTSFGDHGLFIDTSITVPAGVDENGTTIAANPIDRVLVQPDGRILIAGHGNSGSVFLERYLPNGSPDTTFNGTGHESIAIGANVYFGVTDLRVLADGRITFNLRDTIARLLPDGALDPSLDPNGPHPGFESVPIPASAHSTVYAAAALPNGKFLYSATGTPAPITDQTPFFFGRLNADGSVDTSFGNGGLLDRTPVSYPPYNAIAEMTATDDGTVFAVGLTGNSQGQSGRFELVMRLDGNGNVLPISGTLPGGGGYGSLGRINADAVLVQGGGYGNTPADGTVTASGVGVTLPGIAAVPLIPAEAANLSPLNVDGNGDIYAGGSIASLSGNGRDFAIARYTPKGHVDLTYADDGLARVNFGTNHSGGVTELLFDPSGNLLVIGVVDGHPALARLLNSIGPGDVPDTTPPRVFLTAGPPLVTQPTKSIAFTVLFADDSHVDDELAYPQSALRIAGPTPGTTRDGTIDFGFTDQIDYLNFTYNRLGARYLFTGKHGAWSSADNGTYLIQVVNHTVADDSGNFIPPTTIGTFTVNIPAKPAPPPHHHKPAHPKGIKYGHTQ
jgi:uncharacterized delta-60 repeat protein